MKINDIIHGEYKLEKLIKIWKPYFFKMAGNFTTNQILKEDLVAECNVSLWQSNENYDKDKGMSFYTYIATQARFAMLNYLNQKGTTAATIFIPNNKKEDYSINTISMDTSINDYQAISETIADEIEEDIDDSKIFELRAHMKLLKKSYSDILHVKYNGEWSDTDIAYVSGVTKQRIGQVVDKSIKILQREFGIEQVGPQSQKHTGLPLKEKKLREKHNIK